MEAKRLERWHVFGILVAVLILVSAVSVWSRQTPRDPKKDAAATVMPPTAVPAKARNYVTVKVGGQEVHVDSQTGEIQQLTPEEAAKLAAELKPMLNKSSEGLVEVQHPDDSVSMDLEGRFQNVTVARINKDGSVSQSCVDNPRAAAAFFGIDPKLIENAPARTKTKFNRN
ncbi:MAG: hypothetical protein AABM67_22120 [Acidobacteriota bacterium]